MLPLRYLSGQLTSLGLVVAVIVSAIIVFVIKHDSRQAFVEQQVLEAEQDELSQDWGRLLIEQSTWENPAWVEKEAQQRLHMILPEMMQVEVLTP